MADYWWAAELPASTLFHKITFFSVILVFGLLVNNKHQIQHQLGTSKQTGDSYIVVLECNNEQ
jgi:hypothetical protein